MVPNVTGRIADIRKSATPIVLLYEDVYAWYYGNIEPCDLRYVGSFHSSAIGWAMKKGHPLLPSINTALAELNKTGEIDKMVHKWWKGTCPEETSGSDRVALVTFDTIVFGLVLSITSLY